MCRVAVGFSDVMNVQYRHLAASWLPRASIRLQDANGWQIKTETERWFLIVPHVWTVVVFKTRVAVVLHLSYFVSSCRN